MFDENLYEPFKDKFGKIVPGKFVLKNLCHIKKFKFKINWLPSNAKNQNGVFIHIDKGLNSDYRKILLQEILRISGVSEAAVYPYVIYIEKAEAFEWDESPISSSFELKGGIIFDVLQLLKQILNCELYEEMPNSRKEMPAAKDTKNILDDYRTDSTNRKDKYQGNPDKPEEGALSNVDNQTEESTKCNELSYNLYTWGDNKYGQRGDRTNVIYKKNIFFKVDYSWLQLSCGLNHIIALNDDNKMFAWGENNYGQVGNGNKLKVNYPLKINENHWISIACGYRHSLAINSLGELYAWGDNEYGQLGTSEEPIEVGYPIKISNKTNWVRVFAGGFTSFAINSNNELFGWGHNLYGQVGCGTSGSHIKFPTFVSNKSWLNIEVGKYHSIGLDSSLSLFGWGRNNYGQVGITGSSFLSPTLIPTMQNCSSFGCGANHTVATTSDGRLFSWGLNCNGQLGFPKVDFSSKPVPSQVGEDKDWLGVSCGYATSFAQKINKKIYGCGKNSCGELGIIESGDVDEFQTTSDIDWFEIKGGEKFTIGLTKSTTPKNIIQGNDIPIGIIVVNNISERNSLAQDWKFNDGLGRIIKTLYPTVKYWQAVAYAPDAPLGNRWGWMEVTESEALDACEP